MQAVEPSATTTRMWMNVVMNVHDDPDALRIHARQREEDQIRQAAASPQQSPEPGHEFERRQRVPGSGGERMPNQPPDW
jgi:hypothetical protein